MQCTHAPPAQTVQLAKSRHKPTRSTWTLPLHIIYLYSHMCTFVDMKYAMQTLRLLGFASANQKAKVHMYASNETCLCNWCWMRVSGNAGNLGKYALHFIETMRNAPIVALDCLPPGQQNCHERNGMAAAESSENKHSQEPSMCAAGPRLATGLHAWHWLQARPIGSHQPVDMLPIESFTKLSWHRLAHLLA